MAISEHLAAGYTRTPQYIAVRSGEVRAGGGARRPVSRVLSRAAARAMAIHLGRPSPGASRDRPGRQVRKQTPTILEPPYAAPTWSCSRRGLPCRARRRARGALLPHPFTLARRPRGPGRAVSSLWHFPWGRPRRALPGSVPPWSPDFPPPRLQGDDGGHPAVWRLLTTPRLAPGQAPAPPTPPAASAHTRSSTASVSRSIAPSTRAWRKCRWKARTTAAVAGPNRPSGTRP